MSLLENGIESKGSDFTMDVLGEMLNKLSSEKGPNKTNYAGINSKLLPLYKNQVFGKQLGNDSIWDTVFKTNGSNRTVSIFQFNTIADLVAYTAVDLILWDLWNYAIRKETSEDTPHLIVLDEFQNLSLREESPVRKMLQEGRKMGLNLVLATQTLSGIKSKDGQDALSSIFNAATILFFKPNAPETKIFAENANALDKSKSIDSWSAVLSSLERGECVVFTRDELGKMRGKKIKITSMEER